MKDIVKKISKNIFIFPLLLVMLTLVIGVSYAYYEISFAGKKEISLHIEGGISLTFNWNNTSYTLDDDKMSNENGKEQDTYYEFSVSATASKPKNINYLIYIEEDQTNTIDNSNVFVYLTDDSDNMMKAPIKVNSLQTYQEANTKSLFVNGFSFVKEGTKIHNYRLRSWLDEDSTQTGTYKYQVKVVMSEDEKTSLDQEGVYITSAKYLSDTSVDETLCEIENAYATKFDTNIELENDNSSITYEITIYNSYDYPIYLKEIIKDEYTNEDITYTLDGFNINDEIASKESKTFTITYNRNNASDKYLSSDLIFDFGFGIESEFLYVDKEEIYIIPRDGIYKLEVWGAQGGSYSNEYHGGYGAYSVGYVSLKKGDELFVNVGGAGVFESGYSEGGYNGGGDSTYETSKYTGSGGGATHIALTSGVLSSLSSYAGNNNSPILIVAGGGGGTAQSSSADDFGIGGSGGGVEGSDGTSEYDSSYIGYGGTQTSGGTSKVNNGSFGQGGHASTASSTRGGGGGGGYYGGGSGYKYGAAGGGGSGYIANINLFDKYMMCYECQTSSVLSEKTYTTGKASEIPIADYAKKGNGYAKIKFIDEYENMEFEFSGFEKTYTVKTSGIYKLEVWGAQGGSYSNEYHGGYGAYSVGNISLTSEQILFINIGGVGVFESGYSEGGYNGGGNSTIEKTNYTGSGGGATHIATTSGELASLSSYAGDNNSPILIVAGGGGGSAQDVDALYFGVGGSGGGIQGNDGTSEYNSSYIGYGGTQDSGGTSMIENGSFGKGGNASTTSNTRGGAGGGGYYGGGSGYKQGAGGGGGSGYIGNAQLTNKYMVCYSCTTSNEENTKTISTKNISDTPISDYMKIGNGYAKITYLGK